MIEEYAAALGVDLCFQNFSEELTQLRQQYGPPDGCLLLAIHDGKATGCVALRNLEDGICEMKRLYVKPDQRSYGIGRKLSEAIVAEAHRMGYRKMRLDTLESMTKARELYRKLGFGEIPEYRYNPIPGTVYMELDLGSNDH